jgi:hypothetical protein
MLLTSAYDVKEFIEQNADKIQRYFDLTVNVGFL